MKNIRYVFLSTMALGLALSVSACGGNSGGGTPTPREFSFDLRFESGRTDTVYVGETYRDVLYANENLDDYQSSYTMNAMCDYDEYDPAEYFTFTKDSGGKSCTIVGLKPSPVIEVEDEDTGTTLKVTVQFGIRFIETNSDVKKTKWFTIGERYPAANTGYNFSADTDLKAEALGKLEAYAMKNYLTGITLFENGGYTRFSPRVKEIAPSYVTGYGFGLLTDGKIEGSLSGLSPTDPYKDYYRTATSSNPGNINGWQATGSQVGDLFGYITSSFWGTKLNASKTGYVWYPVLANDPDYKEELDNAGPIPQDGQPTDTIHKKWRVYVKTGTISYKSNNAFNDTAVTIDDYITTFQLLLTQKSGLTRGAELATDTSYGLKGAISYFRNTKNATDAQAETTWDDMVTNDRLGIKKGHDEHGDFIDFEFVNPIDQFTAMYTLSSSLYSPMPKNFLKQLGGGSWIAGGAVFGTKNGTNVRNNIINLGPYYMSEWNESEIVFTQNRDWFEYVETQGTDRPRYRIPGVHMLVVTQAQQKDDAIYNEFENYKLDSTGIPASRFSEKVGTDLPTKGDATFKLNVNACSQDRWKELFMSNKYPNIPQQTEEYPCKPLMSNINFLNGLFWSIDRQTFASQRGVNPSYNFFADAYLSDPRGGVSYNSTQAHKDAEDDFDEFLRESGTFGYSKAKATAYFNKAVEECGLTKGPTPSQAITYNIDIQWMYQNDEFTYGQQIATFFEDAFNTEDVGDGCVKIHIVHNADSQWEQVYNDHLMIGKFDLGFGAISGNTLNPLNFMEVLKSDNSSGFTLNWGADTSKVDEKDPIVFDVPVLDSEGHKQYDPNGKLIREPKEWSYDALWAAADHGSVVVNGESKDSVSYGYTEAPRKIDSSELTNFLDEGAEMKIPFAFYNLDPGTKFEIDRTQLFLVGFGYLTIDPKWISYEYDKNHNIVSMNIVFDDTEIYIENVAVTQHKIDPETGKPMVDPETGKFIDEVVYKNMTFTEYVNYLLFSSNNFQKVIDDHPEWTDEQKEEYLRPFAYDKYGLLWDIEITYNITIAGSVPTESTYAVEKVNSKPTSKYSFAK